jgi:hypothetical protein
MTGSTLCKGCGRIVLQKDVDAAGRCCFCQTTGLPEQGLSQPADAAPKATEATGELRMKITEARASLTDKRGNENESEG